MTHTKAFPKNAGLWGDSFDFVNALLSALAFAGVVTLWVQRRELQLQREELQLNRAEMEENCKVVGKVPCRN
jgi:hypothetical protein